MTSQSENLTVQQLRKQGLLEAPAGAGAHFKAFLERKNMTAASAARDLNIAKSTVTRFINGESELSIELAAKINRTFQISIPLLFKLEADYKSHQAKLIALERA
ncbi:helix-turn-helix transcriptional regulator [Pseudidiomarina aestuarii]|uniref:helix-turn-helix transcriptional regulator n=1 Tax=Pseudidiomarina aestuarii TaxID=624146 RepID=UPI003A97C3D3